MKWLVTQIVRTRFTMMSREKADAVIRQALKDFDKLTENLKESEGSKAIRVPKLLGVDEDMRGWSIYQMLEHNVIVNRIITHTASSLAQGVQPTKYDGADPKKDVMPSDSPGLEQVVLHRESITDYLSTMAKYPNLRDTPERNHPNFGPFDAHKWNCMFGFHLNIHLRQAQVALRQIRGQ